MDPLKVNEFITVGANIDNIEGQIEQLKAVLANSPGGLEGIESDDMLRESILRSSAAMGGVYLLQMDNAIIGTGFAQLVLEGRIEKDLHYLTYTALTRQLLPILIDRYDVNSREVRREMLTKMKDVIEKVNL
ncbi:MAG: hypothetical protein IPG86_07555 [Chitinophagaceae bacterium]|nr:hypothetical protein [Chitinophagaceae bacterium]